MSGGPDSAAGAGRPPGAHSSVSVGAVSARDHATVHIAGQDIVLVTGTPYRLTPWPAVPELLTWVDARTQPSRLLKAGNGVVPFRRREAEMDAFHTWRLTGGAIRIQLIHGGGGQGKTRFADEVARRSMERGWGVWSAPALRRTDASGVFTGPTPAELSGARGMLVVVDYADRYDTDALTTLLELVRGIANVPVRILLLARQTGAWWHHIWSHFGSEGIDCTAIALPPLSPRAEQRPAEFGVARDRFAEVLGHAPARRPGRRPVPRHDWGHAAYELVLTVHMAALVAVLAELSGDEIPSNPLDVSLYLLARERTHWSIVNGPHDTLDSRRMDKAVFVATLTGGLPSYAQGERALRRLGLSPGEIDVLIDDHRLCYPPPHPDSPARRSSRGEPVLEPLYPDRLGEDFLALTIPGHRVRHYPSYPAAVTWPARLLTPDESGLAPEWTRPALTTLVETARHWTHVAEDQLAPLLRAHPELAVAAGGGVIAALAELLPGDVELLSLIRSRLPAERSADLDVGAAALAGPLAGHDAAQAESGPELARGTDELVRVHSRAGELDTALRWSQGAVESWRLLAGRDPAAHGRDLVRALITHAGCLTALRLTDEASAAAEEAVAASRGAVPGGPGRAELAYALLNAAGARRQAGREDGADAAAEAVGILRALTVEKPDRYGTGLATALTLLCELHITDDDPARAEAAGREAVSLLDVLAKQRPPLRAELSRALSELARALAQAGTVGKAIPPGSRAVRLRRELARDNPLAFNPRLAISLMNLAGYHADLDDHRTAVPLAREAVDVFEQCARTLPRAYGGKLLAAAENLARILERAGRYPEADAVRRRHRLPDPE
ncbi:tetratricopeptide repeat protein [Streptomyces sp. CAU 1734]|uniref:tetratricopeptide repeat protein n=1 Tax=Streptomyces sp. CAU 1734 TaxID=3140360 RepID=UPI0032613596